jgi:cell division FtsZ-interacting protein ZapD
MYPLVYQKGMTQAKWHGYPRFQQILSIANELNRAQNALLKGDQSGATHAWERAFELTDLTLEDHLSAGLLKEMLRFREMLGELFLSRDVIRHGDLIKALISLDKDAYKLLGVRS